jgi:hypothetical protein
VGSDVFVLLVFILDAIWDLWRQVCIIHLGCRSSGPAVKRHHNKLNQPRHDASLCYGYIPYTLYTPSRVHPRTQSPRDEQMKSLRGRALHHLMRLLLMYTPPEDEIQPNMAAFTAHSSLPHKADFRKMQTGLDRTGDRHRSMENEDTENHLSK